jgi:hypothetical protein
MDLEKAVGAELKAVRDRTGGVEMNDAEKVTALVGEYRTLFAEVDSHSPDSLKRVLVREGEWTPEAAAHLLRLARQYGSFLLRNALAVSLALDIEDGELGF